MPRPSALCPAALLLLGVVTSACHDASSDPMAVLVAAETHGALSVGESLPSLGDLAREADSDAEPLARAREMWIGSWDDAREGRPARMDAYVLAAPALARDLGLPGIEDVVADVRRSVDGALALDPVGIPTFVVYGLAESEALVGEAEQALGSADGGRALLLALEASDRLRELAPESVARDLIAAAEEALRRNVASGSYSGLKLERGRHLLVSAEEAVESGDYLRAIRRAYYACQLLDVSPAP